MTKKEARQLQKDLEEARMMCESKIIQSQENDRPTVIPAIEAYNITKSAVSGRVIEEIQTINEAIRTAAEDGSYGINLDMLSSEAEKLLEDAGYKVTRSSIQNGQIINIQWKEGFK